MTTGQLVAASSIEQPPPTSVGMLGWLRKNLFSSWANALVTVWLLIALVAAGQALLGWALGEANWGVITSNFRVLVWGRYPADQVWRLGLALLAIVALGFASWRVWRSGQRRSWPAFAWVISPLALTLLLRGVTLPTPLTVTNHLGYYLYRPELIAPLGAAWRVRTAVLLVGLLGGMSWGWTTVRGRIPIGLALAGLAGLFLPYALLPGVVLGGVRLPNLVALGGVGTLAWIGGRGLSRRLANAVPISRLLLPAWIGLLPTLVVVLTDFDVGVERVAPAAVLPIVEPAVWSGMLLTLVLAAVSILASFPIGVLLALGRRSRLPVVKGFCTLMIELVRGVPLITILFMAQVMLPLFLPMDLTLDRVLRAMAGLAFFTAAYLAEIVRGGLQAVRRQQYEAARALGLSELLVTGLVVLPQALRAVIPPIMGQFVSIFKDTTLVAIVGLLDLLAVAQSVIKQREFLGLVREVYLFAAVFYFVISFSMSRASRRLERRLGIEQRL